MMNSTESTCMVCLEDYPTDIMIEDIAGTMYCYVCSEVCMNCGINGHDCEGEDND